MQTGSSAAVGVQCESDQLETHPEDTARRYANLRRHCREHLLHGDEFVCTSAGACRRSASKAGVTLYEGVMSYVGRHYDTTAANTPLRVLVVAMEDGSHTAHVGLGERRAQIGRSAALPFRQRNPHMRGVTLALRLAFGRRLEDGPDGEFLETEPRAVHLFDAFALANLTLCSAVTSGTRSSRATSVMRDRCLGHLAATIRILQPTLIVSQGVRLDGPLTTLFRTAPRPALVTPVRVGDAEIVWVNLRHPTYNWDWPNRPYFTTTVVPAIRTGRLYALRLASR